VAIMDLDQHMYMAIEAVESKFLVVGVLHHSVAGERALFKVNWYIFLLELLGEMYLFGKRKMQSSCLHLENYKCLTWV
jgi:hypothetical protein